MAKELYIWGDPHLNHDNIRRFCGRPFPTVKEMNEALISNYNEVVNPKDDVIIVGDFAWSDHNHFLAQLHGRKTLIIGNHDKMPEAVLRNFTQVIGTPTKPGILETCIAGQKISFSHYPLYSWNASFHGSWNIHGHCHGRLTEFDDLLRTDAGVDLYNFYPVNFEVLKLKLQSRVPAWKKKMEEVHPEGDETSLSKNKTESLKFKQMFEEQKAKNTNLLKVDYTYRKA